MNTLSKLGSFTSARISLALAAVAVVGCLSTEARESQQAELALNTTDSSGCVSSEPANSIRLEGSRGETLQLAYFAGCGWKYISANPNESLLGFMKAAFHSAGAPEAAVAAVMEDPTTVFIDGPTGYTFAWTPADGWKFVGRLKP